MQDYRHKTYSDFIKFLDLPIDTENLSVDDMKFYIIDALSDSEE